MLITHLTTGELTMPVSIRTLIFSLTLSIFSIGASAQVVVIPLLGDETPTYKTVFITSSVYDGDLGGAEGADSICQTEARSGGAKLAGKIFKAWISGGLAEDLTMRGRVFTRSSLPYHRVDGVKVADDYADLLDGSILAQLFVTPDGAVRSGELVRTGLYTTGVFHFNDCVNWTSSSKELVGQVGVSSSTGGS
jgi:hypothetical protein